VPELVNLWRQKDSKATTTFNCYLELLGACFANLVMSYDPDIIVLGGGISLVDEIIEQLPSAIKPFIFANFSVPLITRAKFGDASGVRGAALLTRATRV
jgi:N-acetylglucosamine kinase